MRPVTGSSVAKENLRPSRSWALLTTVGYGTRPKPSPSGGSLRKGEWLRSSKLSKLSFNVGCMIAWLKSVHGFRRSYRVTTYTMLFPATSTSCTSSNSASTDYGEAFWFAAVRQRERGGRNMARSSIDGYHHPASCIPIPKLASTPLILRKSRMRKRARTDPSGGRPVMGVPTGTATSNRQAHIPLSQPQRAVILTRKRKDLRLLLSIHSIRRTAIIGGLIVEPIAT
jgi:hypothetical protein